MSTAEAMRDVLPGDEGAAGPRLRPSSPVMRAGWLLRAAGFTAVAAGVTGVIVAPGLRGNASESVVVWAEWAAGALGYFLVSLLVALVVWGTLELVRTQGLGVLSRGALIGGSAVVTGSAMMVAFFPYGMRERVYPALAVLVAAAAIVTAIAGAYVSARAPHTRAVAGMLFALAFAAIARLAAWELAMAANDRASVQLYAISRGLATAGVMFEAFGQLVAVTWLGTRSKLAGQLGSSAALVGAFVLTWGVAKGVHGDAAPWQGVLHTALADAPGMPPPFGLDAVATFLVPASLLLALVVVAQPQQVIALLAATALGLVSRGAFDAPLRALCVVAAAQWAALACIDERAMWRTLIDDRKRRLAEDDLHEAPPRDRG
jgi:hypothetical protein